MEKISLIIPVYNSIDYLEKCLESAINQTYENMEFICVDDGSNDGSEVMVDDFAKRDKRVIAIHKKNGGESSARNAALKVASGDYIGFLDCDDWIEPDMYETLIKTIKEKNVDMVASGYIKEIDGISVEMKNELPIKEEVFQRNKLFEYLYKRDSYRAFSANLWCKLFKRQLFFGGKEQLWFDEEQRLGGDVLICAKLAANCKTVFYINRSFYHYRIRENSTWHAKNLPVRVELFQAYDKIMDFLKSNKIEPECLIWVKRFYAYHAKLVAEIALEQRNEKVLAQSQEKMTQFREEYFTTNSDNPERLKEFESIRLADVSGGK